MLVEIIRQIWKPLLILIGIILLLGLAAGWIGGIAGMVYTFPMLNFLLPGQSWLFGLSLMNVLFVISFILTSIVLFLARLAYGTRLSKSWKWGLIGFLILNVISLSGVATYTASQFAYESNEEDQIALDIPDTDTLVLHFEDVQPHKQAIYFEDQFFVSTEEMQARAVRTRIEKSDDKQLSLRLRKSARGRTLGQAAENLTTAVLNFQQKGNQLFLPAFYELKKGDAWRVQNFSYHLEIPEGTLLRIHGFEPERMGQVEVKDWDQEGNMAKGKTWRMEANGLVCLDCGDKTERAYRDFSRIKIEGFLNVLIDQQQEYEVLLDGKETLLQDVTIRQLDDQLLISGPTEAPRSTVELRLGLPHLSELSLIGTEDVKVRGFREESLVLLQQGEQEVLLQLDARHLDIQAEGEGELEVEGHIGHIDARLKNAFILDAEQATFGGGDINLSNGSRAFLVPEADVYTQADESSKVIKK